jgi:aryl-alcohol dehydrogenase-like predicted oxidoreductase
MTLPIPGTSSIPHFDENLQATELELDDEDVAALEEISTPA